MALLRHRRDRIARIERKINCLQDRATKLLEREHALQSRVEELRQAEERSMGRLRAGRVRRSARRVGGRLERIQSERRELVERELDRIMGALEAQSRRTRTRLDRELERLAPVEEEWERLRATFDALGNAVNTAGIEQSAGALGGVLQIPEFPVQEREGYVKPFPRGAMVF
jgi:DNA repair exonuclease SbcCD ATPase subunit